MISAEMIPICREKDSHIYCLLRSFLQLSALPSNIMKGRKCFLIPFNCKLLPLEKMSVSYLTLRPSRGLFRKPHSGCEIRTLWCLKRDTGLSFGTFQAVYIGLNWAGYIGSKFQMGDPCLSLITMDWWNELSFYFVMQ